MNIPSPNICLKPDMKNIIQTWIIVVGNCKEHISDKYLSDESNIAIIDSMLDFH